MRRRKDRARKRTDRRNSEEEEKGRESRIVHRSVGCVYKSNTDAQSRELSEETGAGDWVSLCLRLLGGLTGGGSRGSGLGRIASSDYLVEQGGNGADGGAGGLVERVESVRGGRRDGRSCALSCVGGLLAGGSDTVSGILHCCGRLVGNVSSGLQSFDGDTLHLLLDGLLLLTCLLSNSCGSLLD
ncbi:hypothetical protein PFISCL1PPCAC_7753, partial [Pristionchus fissidentatus]